MEFSLLRKYYKKVRITAYDRVGSMPTNMRIFIYEKSNEKMKIGTYNDYWYRVAAENGFHGWCFGAFITLRGKVTYLEGEKPVLCFELLNMMIDIFPKS